MADENDAIWIKFGAKLDELNTGLKSAEEAVKQGVAGMKGQLESLNKGFELITKGFMAFQAAVAGGSALKSFVASSIETTKEAVMLGKTLGITATDASYLASALNAVGVSQDAVNTAAKRVTMQIVAGGDAFKNLGVPIRDAQGQLRNTKDVMMDTNAALSKFAEGTDRNVEGMKIYGRQWAEVAPMVAKFKGETEESRRQAEELNLVVGKESVVAMANYKQMQRDAGEVMKGIQKTIGDELIPRLTELGRWFKEIGPDAIKVVRIAMQGYLTVQDAVKDSVFTLLKAISTSVKAIVSIFTDAFGSDGEAITAMEFFQNVVKLVQVTFISFRIGIQEASAFVVGAIKDLVIIAKGWAEMTVNGCMMVVHAFETVYVGLKGLAQIAIAAFQFDWEGVKRAAADTGEAIKRSVEKTASDIHGVGAAWDKMGEDRKANMQATLDSMVEIARKGREDIDKAITTDISKAKPITKIEGKEKEGLSSKGADEKKDLEARIKIWETELVQEKTKFMKQNEMREMSLEDEQAYWKKILGLSDLTQKEKIAVSKKIADAELAAEKMSAAQRLEIQKEVIDFEAKSGMELLDRKKAEADQQQALGLINNAQRIAMDRNFETEKYNIEKAALEKRLELASKDPNRNLVERQKLLDQLLELQSKYESELTKISNKASLEQQKGWLSVAETAKNSIASAITGLLTRTQTLGGAISSIFKAIGTAIIEELIAKPMARWAVAAVQSKLINASQAMSYAGVAGAAGVASAAAIPVIGWEIAPEAGAADYAAAAGFAAVASARGGFDIPKGVNPITQLHEKEMVLPEKQANVIRNMADEGGSAGQTNITIHAVDAASVKKLFMDHGSALVDSLKKQQRNFAS